jgi:hypothetical protein
MTMRAMTVALLATMAACAAASPVEHVSQSRQHGSAPTMRDRRKHRSIATQRRVIPARSG